MSVFQLFTQEVNVFLFFSRVTDREHVVGNGNAYIGHPSPVGLHVRGPGTPQSGNIHSYKGKGFVK